MLPSLEVNVAAAIASVVAAALWVPRCERPRPKPARAFFSSEIILLPRARAHLSCAWIWYYRSGKRVSAWVARVLEDRFLMHIFVCATNRLKLEGGSVWFSVVALWDANGDGALSSIEFLVRLG